jgi:hypothetical protein
MTLGSNSPLREESGQFQRTLRLPAIVIIRQTFASGEVTHLIMRVAAAAAHRWPRGWRPRRRDQARRRRTGRGRCVARPSRGVDGRRRTSRGRRRHIPVIILRYVGLVFTRRRHAGVSIRRVGVLPRRSANGRRHAGRGCTGGRRSACGRGRARSHGVRGIVGTAGSSGGRVRSALVEEATVGRNLAIAC